MGLMNWGNAIVRKKTYSLNPVNFVASVAGQGERLVTELELELHLQGDVKKTSKTEALADCNVAALKEDAIVQFDRKGFFRIDKQFQHGDAAVAFQIPTGKKM